MAESTGLVWRLRDRLLDLSRRPLVMGILNVTPDSFSDGGQYLDPADAVARALAMVAEGADIIDVGAESTRPGAKPVGATDELSRLLPVLEALRGHPEWPADTLISVDTQKAAVARAALRAGAHIINDVSGLAADAELAEVVAEGDAGLVLMHLRGTPETMQERPRYHDLLGEIRLALKGSLAVARRAGIPDDAVLLDPGIGFGKTFGHNWEVLAHLEQLLDLGRPLLIGTSRKGFLRARVGEGSRDLLLASLTTAVAACLQGARVVRVHDVAAHRVAAETVGALWAARS